MVCNLGSIANTKSSSGSVLRSASYEMPEVDFVVRQVRLRLVESNKLKLEENIS